MTLQLLIDGEDFTSHWRPYESQWTSRAYLGESAQSSFILDDDDGDISHLTLATRKIVEVWEDASGSSVCLYRGRIANKTLGVSPLRTGASMRWTVYTEDSNIDLRGIRVVKGEFDRSEESDVTRVQAVRDTFLHGSSSTSDHARDSTDLDDTLIVSDDPVTLAAQEFDDTYPNDLLGRVVEGSSKTFFVVVNDDGSAGLYYGSHDDETYASDISIIDRDITADQEDVYTPDRSEDSGEHEGQQLISGGGVRYGSDSFYEYSDAVSEGFHDKWEEHFTDDQYVVSAFTADKFIKAMVNSRNNENFTYTATFRMNADNVHRLKAGMSVPLRLYSADLPTTTDQRATQVTVRPLTPDKDGNTYYQVTAELGVPRGRPFRLNGRRTVPWPPTQPTAGSSLRLYHSAHLAGDSDTAEAQAAPNLGAGNLDSGWEGNNGGGFEAYMLYDTPASTVNGAASWTAVNAAAGQYAVRSYLYELSGDLLDIIQAGGGTVRMQAKARSRYGIGISEAAQDNVSAWCIRVYRPGTASFVGTAVALASGGSSKFPAQATHVNRLWSATLSAVAGAQSGDYLVVEIGTNHIGPTSGGTGVAITFTDTSATDLPEDELETGALNSWIEFSGTGSGGDTTQPIVNPGEESVGTDSDTYAPIDHTHAHGFLADDGVHMHDADQIDGLDLQTTGELGAGIGTGLTRYGQILTSSGTGSEANRIDSPSIFWDHERQRWGMVYAGYSDSGGSPNQASLHLAYSDDLLAWEKYASNPILSASGSGADSQGCTGGYIYYEDGTYHLFYIGLTATGYEGGTKSLCRATATDPQGPWTRHGAVITPAGGSVWHSDAIWHPNIVEHEGTYYLFFNAIGGGDGRERIGYATADSLDGTWTVNATAVISPTLTGSDWDGEWVADPSLYRQGDYYYMAYSGKGTGAADHGQDGIAWCHVDDFPSTWTRFSGNPVLTVGASGEFDEDHAHKPFIVQVPGGHFHFYTAIDADGVWSFGLAISGGPRLDESTTPAGPPATAFLPLTSVDTNGDPVLVWDDDDSLIPTEVPI